MNGVARKWRQLYRQATYAKLIKNSMATRMTAKFTQIKQHILTAIETGQWQEYDKVPSENELAQQFSVSRMTARRALQELSDSGMITRSQGAGSFVAPLKSQSGLLEIRNIADEIRARGHLHQSQVIELKEKPASPEVAAALGLTLHTPVYYSLVLHLDNGRAIQLEERYVNPSLVPQYLEQDFHSQTPHRYLCEVAPLTEASHMVEAVLANPEQQHWLSLQGNEPCLMLTRRTWSSTGIVNYCKLLSPGHSYRLGGHLTFPVNLKK